MLISSGHQGSRTSSREARILRRQGHRSVDVRKDDRRDTLLSPLIIGPRTTPRPAAIARCARLACSIASKAYSGMDRPATDKTKPARIDEEGGDRIVLTQNCPVPMLPHSSSAKRVKVSPTRPASESLIPASERKADDGWRDGSPAYASPPAG